MRFIHIADIHIGMMPDIKKSWSKERMNEIMQSFLEVIETCNREQVDLLLIAGDLFHKQPLLRELKEVNYAFSKLLRTRVVLMAGNHDYISPASNYRDFKWNENVSMFMSSELESVTFDDINTRIYGMSYFERNISEAKYNHIKPCIDGKINILLAHGGDERNTPIDRKLLMNAGFDYIALGHIHKPEIISKGMAYAGSLEPLDRNETGEHGYILGEITGSEDSQCEVRFIRSCQRRYIPLAIDIMPHMTVTETQDMARSQMDGIGERNLYHIVLEGVRDPDIQFEEKDFLQIGNVTGVIDNTIPDYNFEAIYRENKDNMIGMYIDRIRKCDYEDEIIDKALYLGIRALMRT